MKSFIRIVEYWVPDATGTMLEFGDGLYGNATLFAEHSRRLCFGRGEGLPGEAWERGRPIVLKDLSGANFLRARVAAAEGLTCGIAMPIFCGDRLTAVLVIFCGDDASHAGAIELWHADLDDSPDMRLDDGYYGGTSEVFEFVSRHTSFRRGYGLPGLVWDAGLPVFMSDLRKGTRFIRADSATQVGINRGFGLPCATPDGDRHVWVLAFLSALATPLVRRFEVWQPEPGGRAMRRRDGFCEGVGDLGGEVTTVGGAVAKACRTAVPVVVAHVPDEPAGVGDAAREAGLESMLAVPVVAAGAVSAVVAWYF